MIIYYCKAVVIVRCIKLILQKRVFAGTTGRVFLCILSLIHFCPLTMCVIFTDIHVQIGNLVEISGIVRMRFIDQICPQQCIGKQHNLSCLTLFNHIQRYLGYATQQNNK